jgi:hypothetical protein
MTRVFILGAGASRFAGYPLGLDLWRFVRDSRPLHVMAQGRAKEVKSAMESILQVNPPEQHDRPNLEELFTLLDLAARETGPLVLSKVNWSDLRIKLMGMIADAFLWREYCFQQELRDPRSEGAKRVLEKWTNFLRANDTVITFNWDLLHEAALWRAGKWHYADGYGFPCADAPKGARSGIKVLKLHGSANWAQSDETDCEPSVEHKATFFSGGHDGPKTFRKGASQGHDGRNLIIPSYLKDVSANRLLLRLWNTAADALASASEVTVIGFQLYPADALARHLFGSALIRNKPVSRLVVISPKNGINHWDGFCWAIGKAYKRVASTFEDWVQAT